MKRIRKILISVLGVYLLLMLSVSAFQTKFIFQPEKLKDSFTYKFPRPFKELNIKANDSISLNALYFTVPNPKGLILYFHGNKGSLKRWGNIAGDLTKYGYNVLVMDYRGYGKNRGKPAATAMENDARKFYREALKLFPEDSVIVYGRSLGTHFASLVASENHPQKLILETPFTSITDVAKSKLPFLPIGWLIKFPFDNLQSIKKIRCPLIIFHGTQDGVVPYRLGKKLFETATAKEKELITIPDGSHNNLSDFKEYQQSIQKILN